MENQQFVDFNNYLNGKIQKLVGQHERVFTNTKNINDNNKNNQSPNSDVNPDCCPKSGLYQKIFTSI